MLINLAQEGTEAAGGGLTSLLFLAAMVVIFWLLFIRPQRKRMRQQQELQEAIAVGDRIQTVGGIQGVVVSVDDDTVLVDLESGQVRLAKKAVSSRLNGSSAEED